jgi:hypothetical protein
MTVAKLVQRIREEFEEVPGLQISVREGARFWAIDTDICNYVLQALHDAGFLVKAPDGRYRQRQPT